VRGDKAALSSGCSPRAGQGDQFGLRRAFENSGAAEFGLYILAHQRRLESFLDQLSSHATDGVDVGIQRRRDFAVRPTFAASEVSSRMRAFVINCADRLPDLIIASSRSRSSALNFTTYFFAPVPVPATISSILAPAAWLQRFRNAPKFQGRDRLGSLANR